MERQPPVAPSDEIDLYVRTYSSLLRSSGEVRIRAFEEAHAFSRSSLHAGALSPEPDLSAFAYAAGRLPEDYPKTTLVVLGQSHELFEGQGFDVRAWKRVTTRGRRRPLRWKDGVLAVFIASASDIDDLVPILTAYQIEWNKMYRRLRGTELAKPIEPLELAQKLGVQLASAEKLRDVFGAKLDENLADVASRPLDVKVRMLASSYSQYQRAAQRWWSGVEPTYLAKAPKTRRPVYFVSSNTHAIANLVGGAARTKKDEIVDYARRRDPEGLRSHVEKAASLKSELAILPLVYYLLRGWLHEDATGARIRDVRDFEAKGGVQHLAEPGHVDVDAQLIDIAKLDPTRLDPRLACEGAERLKESDAVILNIDYPLGMAAYHLLSRVGQGVGEIRGVYVMGKAATLNGRVGDVSLSGVVYDEHSRNTFLFKNAFASKDVRDYLRFGSVFDNQAALTVRSAFLQNRRYMNTFYRDGYTVLEMEAGPFLSAIYELIGTRRVPEDEIVDIGAQAPFDVGFLHYASDTPNSRRQSLLSKSLSYFGVDATYACAIAIVRRVLEQEITRITAGDRVAAGT
jgi:hypothetical protein